MTKLYYKPNFIPMYYNKKTDDMVEFDTPLEIKHKEYVAVVMDKQSGLIKHIEKCKTKFSKLEVDEIKYNSYPTFIICECEECY
jgi:hypothetical protein